MSVRIGSVHTIPRYQIEASGAIIRDLRHRPSLFDDFVHMLNRKTIRHGLSDPRPVFKNLHGHFSAFLLQ